MPPSPFQNNNELLALNHSTVQQKNTESAAQFSPINPEPSPSTDNECKTALNKSNEDCNLYKNNVELKGEPKQKFGRNICSNIFHLMVKFIKK